MPYATIVYAGDNRIEEDGKLHECPRSLVIQFETEEELREALDDGHVEIEWPAEIATSRR